MINIKNIDSRYHTIEDNTGETHNISPGTITTIPRTMINSEFLLLQVEKGYFIVFPNNQSEAVKKDDEELNDRFGLMDLEP